MLAAACRDEEPAAPPVDGPAEVTAPTEADADATPPDRPRRSLARRIAPLLEPPPPPEPFPPPGREHDELGIPWVGVTECDDYLRNYLRCLESSMPGSTKEVRDALAQAATAWAEVAKTPSAVEGLRAACRTASDAGRSAVESMGCTWE